MLLNAPSSLLRRLRRPERVEPARLALGGLLAAGVALRVWAIVAYPPAVLNEHVHDGANYIEAAHRGLVHGAQEPLGYPLFLRVVHAVSHTFAFTIGVQHALGLLTGALLYLTARRLGAGPWLALVPAAVVWLGGDELFLEHAPLSEPLFMPLVAATGYAGVRSLEPGSKWPLVAGGLSVALLAVRSVALVLPLLLIAWLTLACWRTRQPVRRSVALAAGAILVCTFAYSALKEHSTGSWSIVVSGSGWQLYGRAAEFADCRRFTPPRGTAALCDPSPPNQRPGPGYYLYLGGPAVAAFGAPSSHDAEVRAFALAAIEHQPLDFLSLAATDAVRYVAPGFGRLRYGDFVGAGGVAFPSGTPYLDPDTVREVTSYYGPVRPPAPGAAEGLRAYQSVMRVNGVVLAVLLVIGLAGAVSATGRLRWGLILLLGLALELALLPAVTHTEWRYVVPAEGPIVVAAALALPLLVRDFGGAGSRRWRLGPRTR